MAGRCAGGIAGAVEIPQGQAGADKYDAGAEHGEGHGSVEILRVFVLPRESLILVVDLIEGFVLRDGFGEGVVLIQAIDFVGDENVGAKECAGDERRAADTDQDPGVGGRGSVFFGRRRRYDGGVGFVVC